VKTKAEWVETSNKFNAMWNFPNCLGAIDGKHCSLKCPKNAASLFYNHKVNSELIMQTNVYISQTDSSKKLLQGFHSLILMAVADAEYKFAYFDIGAYGSESDSGVFQSCGFGEALDAAKLDLPDDSAVFGKKIPFAFIADDAFTLSSRILKPYKPSRKHPTLSNSERIFNYR